jgi:predicted choloylglycine hydrolase
MCHADEFDRACAGQLRIIDRAQPQLQDCFQTRRRISIMKAHWLGFPLAALLLSVPARDRSAAAPAAPQVQNADDLYQNYDDDFKRLLSRAEQQLGKEILTYESMAPGLLPKKLTATGTHYEFGYVVGLIARSYGMQMLRRTLANAEMNRRIVELYQAIYPQYLEKARGIAQAYGMTPDDLDFTYLENPFEAELWWRLFKYQQFSDLSHFSEPAPSIGCSLASDYLDGERRQLIGRNFDYRADLPHFLLVSNLDGAYKTIGHSMFQLHQWMMDGVNEKGLFMGLASLGSPPEYASYADSAAYPDRPAIESHHLIRAVLDTCATADEALSLIAKARIWFPSGFIHFLLADARGNSVVVTFDRDKNLIVFPRRSSFLVLTNAALQEGEEYVYSACWRYRTVTDLLRQGISNLADLMGVMEAVRQTSGGIRTIWTETADLARREVFVTYRAEDFSIPHVFGFSGSSLTWPQLALGGGYECTILLSNKRNSDWAGHFNLMRGDNESWDGSWSLDGRERTGSSAFSISIAPRSTVKLRLSGDQLTRSGYLQMYGDGTSTVYDVATSYFYNYVTDGRLQVCTGSAAAPTGRLFWFPVEKSPSINTGLAWAPGTVAGPFPLVMTLFDQEGVQVQQKILGFVGHEARFFDEIFDSVPDGFLGRVRIESQENIHLEVLRLERTGSGFQLTATPPDRML